MCKGHERGLDAIAVNHDKTAMATGSWDTMLKIWSTCKSFLFKKNSNKLLLIYIIRALSALQEDSDDGETSNKRRKPEDGKTRVSFFLF